VLSHPSDKNKDVARVGHPISVAIHKGRINRMASLKFVEEQPQAPFDFAQGRLSIPFAAKNAANLVQDDSSFLL
jgi:hypothetical protein